MDRLMQHLQVLLRAFLLPALFCLPGIAFAQAGLVASFHAGVNVSYNQLKADRPLPTEPKALHRAGTALDFGLHYRFNPRFSLDLHTKAATFKTGLKANPDEVTECVSVFRNKVKERTDGVTFVRIFPPMLQFGASAYLVTSEKVDWNVGAGFGPVFFRHDFNSAIFMQLESANRHFEAILEEERFRQTGWLVNLHTSLAYNFSERSALVLTLNHNYSIDGVFNYQSVHYTYTGKATGTRQNYHVRLLNDGSYSSCTIGYQVRIFDKPEKRRPVADPRFSF